MSARDPFAAAPDGDRADPPTPARRRGPKTPEGKARAALNATKHGLRARHFALLPHEDPAEFEALAMAARTVYRPRCPIERELVEAIVVALWREIRADRLEGEVLADIPPVDGARSCGSDLLEERHRASVALLLRYRAQAAGAVRRAQDALARHRRLVAEAAGEAAGRVADGQAERADPAAAVSRPEADGPGQSPAHRPSSAAPAVAAACTNEFAEPAAPARVAPNTCESAVEPPADPLPEAASPPPRLCLRDAVRKARNPLDTPFLRALGRDPDLVLPVPGLRPEAWPIAQHLADPEGKPIAGQGPYRRVPHLDWGDWLAHQHVLPVMERVAAEAGAAAEPGSSPRSARAA